ncbi:MAG: NTP/NDP exchange transporter [Burkholderiales bacterium]
MQAWLSTRLPRLVTVRPDEIGALVWAFLYFFCLLSSYYILRPLRDEMGVAAGVSQLQWLFTATFLVMLAAVPVFGMLVARFPRRRFVPWVYWFFIACILSFFGLLQVEAWRVTVARAFFVWVSIFNLFVVTVFWGFLADLFSYEQGKRLFGFVAAGGTTGALVGPSLTAALALPLGPTNLLLISALFLACATQCVHGLLRTTQGRASEAKAREGQASGAGEVIGGGLMAGFTEVMRSPFLLLICVHVLLLALTNTFLYFQQASIVAGAFDSPAERTRVFALIDLSVGVVTLLVQLTLTGRLLSRFGAGPALAALALVTMAGFAALALAPVLVAVIAFQASKRATEFALANPARETLFTVVSREQKYKAKSFIDTAVFRGGDAASGWIYTGLRELGMGLASIAWLTVPIAALWAVLLLHLGKMQVKLAADGTETRATKEEKGV